MFSYEVIQKNYARSQKGLRRDLELWLPGLNSLSKSTRESIDAVASLELWHRLRRYQSLSKKASLGVITGFIRNLLKET